MNTPPRSVATPCVKVCIVEEDGCLGCGRTLREIAGWTRYTNAERAEIMAALPARRAAIDLRLAAASKT